MAIVGGEHSVYSIILNQSLSWPYFKTVFRGNALQVRLLFSDPRNERCKYGEWFAYNIILKLISDEILEIRILYP